MVWTPSSQKKATLKRKHALPDLVCDTSPLQYLHQTNLLYLIRELARNIYVPSAVESELDVGRRHGIDLLQLEHIEWIKIESPQGKAVSRLLSDIGPGEAEVLMLALEKENLVAVKLLMTMWLATVLLY